MLPPVKPNRIFVMNYIGSRYSCNPKYICKAMYEQYGDSFEVFWALKDTAVWDTIDLPNVHPVKTGSLRMFYYMYTAAVVITNNGWAPKHTKRKQLVLNTWHGGGCYKRVDNKISEKITHMTSCAEVFTQKVLREDFRFEGVVLPSGMPRNDIFWGDDLDAVKRKVYAQLDISPDKMTVMFAPTWRDGKKEAVALPDISELRAACRERFGRDCVFLFRAHYYMSQSETGTWVDVSSYTDMQELLAATDLLITDYSSMIWDYSFTYRPCFLFVPDLEWYQRERGLESDIDTWGFPVCRTQQDLYEAIRRFDNAQFHKAMEEHHSALGSYENGTAGKAVAEVLQKHCAALAGRSRKKYGL